MISTKLTFAVQPKDAFSPKKKVMGKCKVKIVGINQEPIVNRSGFHCFTNLPSGGYEIEISNRYYLNKKINVETDDLIPKAPAVDVSLEPNLIYPFPKGTTLLRGRVVDEDELDIPDAEVKIKNTDKVYITDQTGRFIFYFNELEEGEEEVTVDAKKPGFEDEEVELDVVKEEINLVKITLKAK